jgi:KUP system potassium uptake protein
MRASNHGEGGILALLALISPQHAKRGGWRAVMVIVGLIGATLLYGDGTITPAISVSSAIEGIKLYAPQMGRFVVPLTLIILVALFLIQHKGTSWIGRLFGPVMLLWFIVIGVLGIVGIAKAPAILAALSPYRPSHICGTQDPWPWSSSAARFSPSRAERHFMPTWDILVRCRFGLPGLGWHYPP